MSVYLDTLINEVLALSESNIWEIAVKEWKIADCEEDLSRSSDCICGKENLRYLFTIENELNGNYLYPIGSSCIRKFGREDLQSETKVQEDMFRLLHAVENNEFITLDSGYFTRKLIIALYEEGAFEDNAYNNYDGMNDCQFLLDKHCVEKHLLILFEMRLVHHTPFTESNISLLRRQFNIRNEIISYLTICNFHFSHPFFFLDCNNSANFCFKN